MAPAPSTDAPATGRGLGRVGRVVVGLFVVVAAALAVLLLTDLDGYDWNDDRFVEQDGTAQTVAVDGDGLIWTAEWETTPACTATDGPDGDALELEPSQAGGRHHGGTIGDWLTTWRVSPSSGAVTVTCGTPGASAGSSVVVTDAPWGPAILAVPAVRAGVLLIALPGVPLGLYALSRRRDRPAPGRLELFDD